MKFKLKLLSLSVLGVLCFSGCQIQPSVDPDVSAFMLVSNDNQPIFEAVNVKVSGFESGELFAAQSKFYPMIETKFQRSGLFDLGETNKNIVVHWEAWKRDRSLPNIQGGRSYSKWSLLESDAEMVHRMEIIVKEDDIVLKRYEYTQMVDHRGRGYLDNANRYLTWFHLGVNPMLRKFFLDLKKDQIISK